MSVKGVDLVDPETGEVINHKGRRMDLAGREIPDPSTVPPPLGYKKQPTMADHMRQLIRSEMLAREVQSQGDETFEEADDFDIGDDYDPDSPYEGDFDPIDLGALQREVQRRRDRQEGNGSSNSSVTPNPPAGAPIGQVSVPSAPQPRPKPAEGSGTS